MTMNPPLKHRARRGANFWVIVLLVAPAFILFSALVVLPVIQAAVYSLYKWNGLGPLVKFRGLQNFKTLLTDTVFQKSLLHNGIIVIVSLAVELPLALAVALVIAKNNFKLAVFFRTFLFLPYVLSEIITGVMWQYIYHPQYGLVRSIVLFFNPTAPSPNLLGDPNVTLWVIMIVIIWKYFGFHMTIYIAGLQDIPLELQEAARMDGANSGQVFSNVTFPLLSRTIEISVLLSVIGSFQIFDIVWAMGQGGPVNAGETMVTYLYNYGLRRSELGYGSAVALTTFVICLAFAVIYRRLVGRSEKA